MSEVLQFPQKNLPESPIADQEARAAALDVDKSCIVEAPAGSGKTGLLVQRYLKLLGHDSVEQPEEVLAITFTRKATAEMEQRVLEQLQAAHAGAPLRENTPFARETRRLAQSVLTRNALLGWNLMDQPQRLNIRSILSICMEIANSHPLLSGNGGLYQPIDTPTPLYGLAARRTLLQFGGPNRDLNNAIHNLLLHRDGNLADCERLLIGMLHNRDQWGELVPLDTAALDDATLDRDVRPKLERSLEAIVGAALSRAVDAMPDGLLQELTAIAARLGLEPGYNGKPSPITLCAGKHRPPQAVAEHLDHWLALISLLLKPSDGNWRAGFARNHIGFEIQKPDAVYLKQLVDSIQNDALHQALNAVRNLPPTKYPDEQWQVAKALFHILRHALVELKLVFAERNRCDYTELALAARATLLSNDNTIDIALSAGGKLRHLLVDEMQDTSTSQYELIQLLTQSWDGHSQTLFLVGDPKQSIYLFRQARVERFLRTVREARLGDIPLTPLHLTANFRSQAALVHNFNLTFGGSNESAPIFPPLDDASLSGSQAVDVPFIAATAVRPQTQPDGLLWHPAILEEEPALSHAQQEALDIRRIIEQRLATPLPPGRTKPWSIAVLARARAHLSAIVAEFKAHDGKPAVPFRAVDIDPLDELPEVLDALALTRALLHPADRIAWLAVLHAPWCGLGLADLLALTGEGPLADPHATVASLISTRGHLLSETGQHLLHRAWPTLEQAIATSGRTPFSIHVERTWLSLGGDAALSSNQLSNVQRYLGVLRELEKEGPRIDLSLLTARLNQLYAEPRTGDIQVELLTIHKAKGLEWDVVLIPSLHRRTRNSGNVLLNWLELDAPSPNEEASIILAPIHGKGGDPTKLNDWLNAIRSQRDRAEEKRLFYVASTRAREELHLFAALGRKSNGDLALPASGTLLKACWPAAEPQFTRLSASNYMNNQLQYSMENYDSPEDDDFAIAASSPDPQPPLIYRLPSTFNPLQRFTDAATQALPYIPAAALQHSPTFDRPEGSFAVRAFGNVVHRYLQLLANRLTATTPMELLAELPTWQPRLLASLRGEGLSPNLCRREASRALDALTRALNDPAGRWILSPQPAAATESALNFGVTTSIPTLSPTLITDRTFLAAADPLIPGDSHIWIVDFKTSEQGSRTLQQFDTVERAKYTAQLESYAAARRALPGPGNDPARPIVLALYYPLIPRFIHWLA